MHSDDFFWLVGLLEGEGSFLAPMPSDGPSAVRITISMSDLDVIERVSDLFGVKYISRRQRKHWKPEYRATLKGSRAAALMLKLWPHMSRRRKRQINRALASCYSKRAKVVSSV